MLLLGGLAGGCATYHLGPTNQQTAGARSVRVAFLHNTTYEPRLTEAVTQALRRHLQQDGTFRLETSDAADLEVEGTLIRYERRPMAFQRRDVVSVQEYELRLTARIVAVDRLNGRRVLDRALEGRTTIQVGADLPSVEQQALPLLADDLARRTTTALTEGGW